MSCLAFGGAEVAFTSRSGCASGFYVAGIVVVAALHRRERNWERWGRYRERRGRWELDCAAGSAWELRGLGRERRELSGTPGTATGERDCVCDWERARGTQSELGARWEHRWEQFFSSFLPDCFFSFRLLFSWRSFASELMTMITKAKRKVTTTLQSE